MRGEGVVMRRGEMDSLYRVFDKRSGVERMWVCMVGMCTGWREGGMGGGFGPVHTPCQKVGEWRGVWRGRKVGKPTVR